MTASTILKRPYVPQDGAGVHVPASLLPAMPERAGSVATAQLAPSPASTRQNIEADKHQEEQTLASLRAESQKLGLQEGLQEAKEQIAQSIKQEKESIQHVLQALEKVVSEVHARYEGAIVDVVMTALVRLLGQHMASREGVVAQVQTVLAEAGLDGPLKIEVHPKDLQILHAALEAGELDAAGPLSLASSAQVMLGGCRIVTEGGSIDGRLETQLAALQAQLTSGGHRA
jgi:flagellar assembly protein FliH